MPIDPAIRDAIDSAIREEGQPAELGQRLAAWFEGLSSGNERLDDPVSVRRSTDLLFSTAVPAIGAESRDGCE
jgi:hypothetical protein